MSSVTERFNAWQRQTGGTSPVGLQQAATRPSFARPMGGQTWADAFAGVRQQHDRWADAQGRQASWLQGGFGQPRWLTGGRYAGTEQGWNTPFYRTMFSQMEEQSKKGMDAPSVYDRQDYTGIITSDAMQGVKVGRVGKGGKFGDIFQHGRRVGNIYDAYDRRTANVMMAQLTLDQEQQVRAFGAADVERRIEEEVQRQRKQNTQALSAYRSQKPYLQKTEKKTQDLLKSDDYKFWSTAAGAGGGAAVAIGLAGMLAAPFTGGASLPVAGAVAAGVVGAGAGGLGAYLNRDQLASETARAMVQWDMQDSHSGSRIATGLMNWSQVADSHLLGLGSNLYQGSYDAVQGTGGDGRSEFYALTDQGERKTGGWAQVAGHAVSFLDFAGVGASALKGITRGGRMLNTSLMPSAMGIYMTTMSGTILGSAGELTLGGGLVFDDATGTYRNVYDQGFTGGLAAWGETAIDVAQLGFAKGMSTRARRSWKGVTPGSEEWQRLTLLDRFRAPKEAVSFSEVNGLRFFRDGEGQLINKVVRPMTTWLAPSELVDSMGPRFHAMRATARNSGALSADDFFRAANRMTTGGSKIQVALLNGFGEGLEETIQEILGPVSLGYNPFDDPGDIFDAALQGFLMGAGMSFGSGARMASKTRREFAQYEVLQDVNGVGPRLSYEQFQELTDGERQTVLRNQGSDFMQEVAKDIGEGMAHSRLATNAGAARQVKALSQLAEAGLATSSDPSATMILSQAETGAVRLDARGLSFERVTREMQRSTKLIQAQVEWLEKRVAESPDAAAKHSEALVFKQKSLEVRAFIQEYLNKQAAQFVKRLDPKWLKPLPEAKRAKARAKAESILQDTNRVLEVLWDASRGEEFTKAAQAQLAAMGLELELLAGDEAFQNRLAVAFAASLQDTRSPRVGSSSVQVYVPHIDLRMTLDGTNNKALVPHSVLKLIQGDFDGDAVQFAHKYLITPESFLDKRSGYEAFKGMEEAGYAVGEWGTENVIWRELSRALWIPEDSTGVLESSTREAGARFLKDLRSAWREVFEGIIPANELMDLVDDFEQKFVASSPHGAIFDEAYQNLMNKLVENYSGEMLAVGRETLHSPMLEFEERVSNLMVRFLQEFNQISTAKLKEHEFIPGADAESTQGMLRQAVNAQKKDAADAATELSSLSLASPGVESMRKVQEVYYSHRTVLDVDAAEAGESGNAQIRRAERTYQQINDMLPRPRAEQRHAKSIAEVAASTLMRHSDGLETEYGRKVSPLLMAYLPADLLRLGGGTRRVEGYGPQANWSQLVLQMAVESERLEYQRAGVVSTDAEARWASYEDLTHPDMSSFALFEVFGHVSLAELGASELAPIAGRNMSLGQVLDKFTAMAPEQRGQNFRILKQSEFYTESGSLDGNARLDYKARDGKLFAEGKPVTTYRILVDVLEEVANGTLSRGKDGKAGGRMGDLTYKGRDGFSLRTSKVIRQNFEDSQTILANYLGLQKQDLWALYAEKGSRYETLKKQVQDFRRNNPDFDRKFVETFPDMAVHTMYVRDEDTGDVLEADWVLDVLLAKPARAELILKQMTLFSEMSTYNFLHDDIRSHPFLDSNIVSRDVKMLKALRLAMTDNVDTSLSLRAEQTWAGLLKVFQEGESIDDYLRYVNTFISQENEPPMTAWTTDSSLVEVTGHGFEKTQYEDSVRLQKQMDFSRQLKQMLKADSGVTLAEKKADAAYAGELLEAYRQLKQVREGKVAKDPVTGLEIHTADQIGYLSELKRLETWIGEGFQPGTLGIDATLHFVQGQVSGMSADTHSKGKSPANTLVLGANSAQGDNLQYGHVHQEVLAALTSSDAEGITGNVEVLRDSLLRVSLGDGTYGTLKPEDNVEFFLEQWSTSPLNHNMLQSIYGQTVYDIVPGLDKPVLRRQLATPPLLRQWLRKDPYGALINDREGLETLTSTQRSEAEKEIYRLLSQELNQLAPGKQEAAKLTAYLAVLDANTEFSVATSESAFKMSNKALSDLVRLSMIIGQMPETSVREFARNLRLEMEAAYFSQETSPVIFLTDNDLAGTVSVSQMTDEKLAEYNSRIKAFEMDVFDPEKGLDPATRDKLLMESKERADGHIAKLKEQAKLAGGALGAIQTRMDSAQFSLSTLKDVLVVSPMTSLTSTYGLTSKSMETIEKEGSPKERQVQVLKQQAILDYLTQHRAALMTRDKTSGALIARALEDAFNKSLVEVEVEGEAEKRVIELPNLSKSEWSDLSKLILTHEFHNMTAPGALAALTTGFPVDDVETQRLYDPSMAGVMEIFLDPDGVFYRAARNINLREGARESSDVLDRLSNFTNRVFSPEKSRGFTPMLSEQMAQVATAVDISGGEEAAPRAGNIPKTEFAEIAHSQRTFAEVPPEAFSQVSFPALFEMTLEEDAAPTLFKTIEFSEEDDVAPEAFVKVKNPQTGEFEDSVQAVKVPFAAMHGRAVRSFQVTIGDSRSPQMMEFLDAEGNVTTNLLESAHARLFTQKYFEEGSSQTIGYAKLDMLAVERLFAPNLQKIVAPEFYARIRGIMEDAPRPEMNFHFDYVSPESLPALGEDFDFYANNLDFEGMIGTAEKDNQSSLFATEYFGIEGLMVQLQDITFQAGKEKHLANPVGDAKAASLERLLSEVSWKTDFAKMIHNKARYLVEHTDAGKKLGYGAYNWARKLMMNRHWVWGERGDGSTILLSAAEVIQLQRAGESLKDYLEGGEVKLLVQSPRELRTMLGDSSDLALGYNPVTEEYDPSVLMERPRTKQEIMDSLPQTWKKNPSPEALIRNYRHLFTPVQAYDPSRSAWKLPRGRREGVTSRFEKHRTSEMKRRMDNARQMEASEYAAQRARVAETVGKVIRNTQIAANVNLMSMFNLPLRRSSEKHDLERSLGYIQSLQESAPNFSRLVVVSANPAEFSSIGFTDVVYDQRSFEKGEPRLKELQRLTSDDGVFLDVAHFPKLVLQNDGLPDYTEGYKQVEKIVDFLTNTGVKITVFDSEGGARELRDHALALIERKGYQNLGDLNHTMVYSDGDTSRRNQNQRALVSSLMATHAEPVHEKQLVLGSDALGTFEGGVVLNERTAGVLNVKHSPLLATTVLNGFHMPTVDQSQRLKAKLIQLFESKDFRKQLAEQHEKQDVRGTRASIERYYEALRSDAVTENLIPRNIKIGDLTPLFKQVGKHEEVYFLRYGHKTDSAKAEAFFQEQRRAAASQSYDSLDPAYFVGIAPPEVSSDWTAYEGRVDKAFYSETKGVTLQVMTSMKEIESKLTHSGLKVVPFSYSRRSMPITSLFNGIEYDVGIDVGAVEGKQVDLFIGGYQEAAKLFGHNPEVSLLKTLFDIDFASLTEEAKLDARLKLNDAMRQFEKRIAKTDPSDVANVVQALVSSTSAFRTIVVQDAVADTEADTSGTIGASQVANGFAEVQRTLVENDGKADFATMESFFVFLYLSQRGSSWDHIRGFDGYIDLDLSDREAVVRHLPQGFTTLYDALLPPGSDARAEMFDKWNDRATQVRTASTSNPVFQLDENWQAQWVSQQDDGSLYLVRGRIGLASFLAHGDSSETYSQSEKRRTSEGFSLHDSKLLAASGNILTPIDSSEATPKMDRAAEIPVWTRSTDLSERLFEQLDKRRAEMIDPELNPHFEMPRYYSIQQQRRLKNFEQMQKSTRRTIDFSPWVEDGNDQVAEELIVKIRQAYGLDSSYAPLVHYWIRSAAGSFETERGANKTISYQKFMFWATTILENAENGLLPLYGTNAKTIHVEDLRAIFRANETSKHFKLSDGQGGEVGNDAWSDWVNISIGTHADGKSHHLFDPLYRTLADANLSTYSRLGGDYGFLQVTHEMLKEAGHVDDSGLARLSWNEPVDEKLTLDHYYSLDHARMEKQMLELAKRPFQEGSSDKQQAKESRKWYRDRHLMEQRKVSGQDYRTQGARYVKQMQSDNGFTQAIIQLRVITALANPALPVSAILEATIWGGLSDIASSLTGDATGAFARLGQSVRERSPAALRNAMDTFLGEANLTLADMQAADEWAKSMGNTPGFRAAMFSDAAFKRVRGSTLITKALQGPTDFVSKLQEPGFGMNSTTLARRYMAAVLAFNHRMQGSGTYIHPQVLIDNASRDYKWVENNLPEAHLAGMASVSDTRGLKETWMSQAVKGIVNPLVNSRSMWVGTTSTLLIQAPLLFSTYGANVLSKVLGIQGFNAMFSMFLHGRRKPWARKKSGPEAFFDLSMTMESADLYKEFMQSGLTYTSLFMFGILAGGFGFAGEDEEEKLMRRMSRFQGWDYLYDPRKIQNDWRNNDAVFFDSFPWLNALFAVTSGDSESGYKSMGELNWILKQFLMPLVGMDRFYKTGDVRQIFWGFEEAMSSFPLINHRQWTDAVNLNTELADSALAEEALGNPENLANSYGFFTRLVFTFERMLFENSFINAIYIGMDKYDRDPFVLAEKDRVNEIQFDRMGNPIATTALDMYRDQETGDIGHAYMKRDINELASAVHAENNLVYMIFKSLVTGQSPFSSSFNRYMMPVKERKIDLEELTLDEGKDLILSVYNEETGEELLTYAGARSILFGLEKGSVGVDSPALQGVHLTYDQRAQIDEDWKHDLIQEGMLVHGLNEWDAKGRMWDIWKGQGDYKGLLPLEEIVWNKDIIPYNPTIRYNQLNTTYIQGPDGSMWATGITRDTLLSASGLQPIKRFYTDERNLSTDSRLNATDPVYNLNTGMRGLERKDESWYIPSDEEIAETQTKNMEKALNNAVKDIKEALRGGSGWVDYSRGYGRYRYSRRGWRNYGSRRSGGYSSGGGSSYINAPRIHPPKGVADGFGRDVRIATGGKANIRRASIRRERFSSQRGRLKPWQ